jgi:hypothetical protein
MTSSGDPFQEHISRPVAGSITGAQYNERLDREQREQRAVRQSAPVAPAGKRPHCEQCDRELRVYRYRKAGSKKLYGTYGDNRFCGLTCGYRWALRHQTKKS